VDNINQETDGRLPRFLLSWNVRVIGGIVDVRTGARRVVGAVLASSRLRHDQRLLHHPAITSHHITLRRQMQASTASVSEK